MPRDTIRAGSRGRLLCHPAVHSQRSRRRSVVGVVLDRRRRLASARVPRSSDRTDDDDDERRSALNGCRSSALSERWSSTQRVPEQRPQ